jgi:predicted MPP superfamily phosphohydrolase
MAKASASSGLMFFFTLAVGLSILALIATYIIKQGVSCLQSHRSWSRLYQRFFIGFFIASITSMIIAKKLPFQLARFLLTVTNPFMLFVANLLLSSVIIDLIRFLNYFLRFSSDNLSQFRRYWFFGTLSAIPIMYVVGRFNLRFIKIVNIEVNSDFPIRQNRELRIALVSDTHLGYLITKAKFREWVKLINSQNPDIIVFAGDVADHFLEPVIHQQLHEEFNELISRYGVFVVSGNHEYLSGDRHGLENYLTKTTQVRDMRDTSELINDSFYVVGRDDKSNRNRMSVKDLLRGLDRTKPVIMIDHQPVRLQELEENGVLLTLCGHTHAGQFFPGTVGVKLVFEISYGYGRRGGSHIYVSSGLGVWGPQCRLGSRSELVNIKVRY